MYIVINGECKGNATHPGDLITPRPRCRKPVGKVAAAGGRDIPSLSHTPAARSSLLSRCIIRRRICQNRHGEAKTLIAANHQNTLNVYL
jgi:hypothetical protein